MAITETEDGTIIVEGRESVNLFRLMSQLSALKLEAKGIRVTRGGSVLSAVKKEHGLKGGRDKVLMAFTAIVDAAKAAHGVGA